MYGTVYLATAGFQNNLISCFQIECSVRLPQRELIQFCKERGVEVIGYRPLGAPGRKIELTKTEQWQIVLNNNYNMVQIANKYNKTTAQIILRYVVSNWKVLDFEICK